MWIRLETWIGAPVARCFDLARSVDLHRAALAWSRERAVAGRTHGRLGPGETVTWSAVHFGLPWRLTSRLTELEPPHRFTDEQVCGPFAWFRHTHTFTPCADGTLMVDTCELAAPFGPLGRLAEFLVLRRYLRRLLRGRNFHLKRAAQRPTPADGACATTDHRPPTARAWHEAIYRRVKERARPRTTDHRPREARDRRPKDQRPGQERRSTVHRPRSPDDYRLSTID